MFKRSPRNEDIFYRNLLKKEFNLEFKGYKTLYQQVKQLKSKIEYDIKLEQRIKYDIDLWKKVKNIIVLDEKLNVIPKNVFLGKTFFEGYDLYMTEIAMKINNDMEMLEEIVIKTKDLEIMWFVLDFNYHWRWQIKFVSEFIVKHTDIEQFIYFIKNKTNKKDKNYLKYVKKFYEDRNYLKYKDYIDVLNKILKKQ